MTVNSSAQNSAFRFLDSNDILDVQSAAKNGSDRESIGSVFSRFLDRIMDFISGQNRSEAKKCLLDLYSPDTSAKLKYEAFKELAEMAGEGHANLFSIQEPIAGDPQKFALQIDLGFSEPLQFVLEKNEIFIERSEPEYDNDFIAQTLAGITARDVDMKQWNKDLVRDGVRIAGVFVKSSEEFDELARENQFTAAEADLIRKVCVQTTFAVISEGAVEGRHINILSNKNPDRSYNISRLGDGTLNIDISNRFNKTEDFTFEEMIEDMALRAEFSTSEKTGSGRELTSLIEGDLQLKLQFPPGQSKPDAQLTGHIGVYAGPLN